jgi:hypothetical protein
MKKFLILMLVSVMLIGVLSGCAGNKSVDKDIELSEIHEAIKAEYGEKYYPDREMELDEVKDYTGLNDEQIEEFIAEAPMMSIGVDTFIAIKASKGNGQAVYEGLEKYRTYLVEESLQYPMNLPKVNAAKVVQYGDYSFFIMLGEYKEFEDVESEEAREYAESEVTRAEKVIEGFFK